MRSGSRPGCGCSEAATAGDPDDGRRVSRWPRRLLITTDKCRLQRVLANLLDKAQPHGGGVSRVTVALTDGRAIVTRLLRGGRDGSARRRSLASFASSGLRGERTGGWVPHDHRRPGTPVPLTSPHCCYPARMPARGSHDETVDALLVASRALVGVAARSLAQLPSDLTLPQFRALVLISTRGALAAGVLADAMHIHPSTATRLIDRLDAKGLVRRQAVDGDRRQISIGLTRRGEAMVALVTGARRRELRAIVDQLAADDRRLIEIAMVQFGEAAGELGESSWQLGWSER